MSAGSSSFTPLSLRSRATAAQLEHWFDYIQSAKVSSVLSSPRSKRAASSADKTVRIPRAPSRLESEFALQLRASGVTGWIREFRPILTRRFRLDFAFPREKVGIECQGGTWSNGRHSRGKGYDADCEKAALLQLAGWTILAITDSHLKNGMALAWTRQALGLEDGDPAQPTRGRDSTEVTTMAKSKAPAGKGGKGKGGKKGC